MVGVMLAGSSVHNALNMSGLSDPMGNRSKQDTGSFDKKQRYSRHAINASTLPGADDLPARGWLLVRQTAERHTNSRE